MSTIELTRSLSARASVNDDRKDTDLSSQAEVDTVEEAESSEILAAREGSGPPGTKAVEQDLKQDSDGGEDASEDQEGNADGASIKGSGSEAVPDIGPHDASGTEVETDVLVLATASGRDGAEVLEILLEGLEPLSSTVLENLDTNAPATLLPTLGFSGAWDSVARLPSSAVTARGYRGPVTILVAGVGTGRADTDPLAVTIDDEAALGHDQTGLLRRAAGRATRVLVGIGSAVLALPTLCKGQLAVVAHGATLGAYFWSVTKNEDRPGQETASKDTSPLTTISVISPLADISEGQEALTGALTLVQVTALTRDLVNEPLNRLIPEVLAERTRATGQEANIRVEIWDIPVLVEQGFGGIFGVAQGSVRPARLARLEWSPEHAAKASGGQEGSQAEGGGAAGRPKHVAPTGKSITLDFGGLFLELASSVPEIKSGMTGAAIMLGATVTVTCLVSPTRVTAWLALVENMPDADAQRPSDVITMFDGTTVEVTNTDAERCLVMAGALARAVTEEPDAVLDVATLTGAQIVAPGDHMAAVMGTPDFREEIVAVVQRAGELLQPMPLPVHLRTALDSPSADLRNTKVSLRVDGILSAGLFLRGFVGHRSRAHFDIAGPAYNDSSPWGLAPTGGTGMGVSTLVELLRSLSAEVSILLRARVR